MAITIPLLVIALIAVGSVALWQRGDLNQFICDGDCGPAYVVAPDELTIDTAPAVDAATTATVGPVSAAKLKAVVTPELSAEVLGPRVGFLAIAPQNGKVLASSGAGVYAPASTTKVLTSFAALSTINPQHRYVTRTVLQGKQLIVVGGGDPYLLTKKAKSSDDRVFQADLTSLAQRTAEALKKSGRTSVSLGFDASLFSGPGVSPDWQPTYRTENIVTPVSALWADQGVVDGIRTADPAMAAAESFGRLLERRGIAVESTIAPVKAASDAQAVAAVRSATVAQIVETLMRVSDNQAAEVMLRHVAIASQQPATFDGGGKGVRAALRAADVDVAGLNLDDGSGLARSNRISPQTLVETIRAAKASSATSGLVADLPVSGFTGTLIERFAGLDGALGTVRAKTGTLRGIHSLAGYALDRGGRPVLFAVMVDRADDDQPLEARAALDRVAAAIATCACG